MNAWQEPLDFGLWTLDFILAQTNVTHQADHCRRIQYATHADVTVALLPMTREAAADAITGRRLGLLRKAPVCFVSIGQFVRQREFLVRVSREKVLTRRCFHGNRRDANA